MKKFLLSVSICATLAFATSSCEDTWNDESTLAYIVEIGADEDGICQMTLSSSYDKKENLRTIPLPCGQYKIGEGIFVEQLD